VIQTINKQIMVIDPGVHTPELSSFNLIAGMARVPCTYHLPAMFGFASFPDDLSHLAGVIVLGSAASVHERLPWQEPLENFVFTVIKAGIPLLGCCYGHQMIAHMFGANVGFVRETREKLKGRRVIKMLENPICPAGERSVIVTHAEIITDVPAGFKVIATSDDVEFEGIAHEKKPIYSFQFHPEATAVFLAGHEMLSEITRTSLSDGHEILRGFVHMVLTR